MESTFLQDNDGNRSILSCLDCGDASNNPVPSGNNQRKVGNNDAIARGEMKQTEDFLAAEMHNLSVQERSEALDDVHCVGEELKETTEKIQQSLLEFEQTVQLEENESYQLACQQDQSYVEDRSFRLKFLRANMYNVGRSVRQMMTFLKCKGEYFGNDKLARDITLNDLNEEDINLLSSGLFHIQKSRDPTGRVIAWIFNDKIGQCIDRAETMIRVCYYIFFNIVCSIPEVQFKGLVTCYYDLVKPGEPFAMPGFNFSVKVLEFLTAIPMRFSALHHCLKTGKGTLALNNVLIGMAMNIFPKDARVRARLHYGSDMELLYKLRTHGFSTETCPVDSDGNIRNDILNTWLDNHKAMEEGIAAPGSVDDQSVPLIPKEEEEEESQSPAVQPMNAVSNPDGFILPPSAGRTPVIPSRQDVLLGRGRTIQNHHGNVFFRDFLKQYRDDYDKAPRNKRRRITTDLVHALKAKGIRFLQQTENGDWIESSFAEAEKKIGQVFRNTRRR